MLGRWVAQTDNVCLREARSQIQRYCHRFVETEFCEPNTATTRISVFLASWSTIAGEQVTTAKQESHRKQSWTHSQNREVGERPPRSSTTTWRPTGYKDTTHRRTSCCKPGMNFPISPTKSSHFQAETTATLSASGVPKLWKIEQPQDEGSTRTNASSFR